MRIEWKEGRGAKTRRSGAVVPDCCKEVQDMMTVTLFVFLERVDGSSTAFKLSKPFWYSDLAIGLKQGRYGDPKNWGPFPPSPLNFCPHCGSRLPVVEKDPSAVGPFYTPDGEGDYCVTCGESWECTCAESILQWRTVQ